MEKKKIDQRVRLTQHLLKNALVQLMQEQHISKISIRAICEFAGINRSTFYVHYTDQYDLLKKVEQEVLDNLNKYLGKQDLSDERPISIQILIKVLDYVKENMELFKALLSENCDFAFQKDLVALAQIISSQQNQLFDLRTQEYIKIFGFTGTISMLQKWLNDGANESPAQMAEFIIQIVYYGISGLKKNTFNP
ncbi:MAG TPA: TetR/AcrR family transcriptional regulator [Paludibacteraceae bacterium]|nr:TetR/AcrR family transcriptional regulator [Paludibacteraceae bacterium]